MSHVLIIEDNKTLAFGLRNNLEIEGYQVTTAFDGKEGLRAALDVDPDLVCVFHAIPVTHSMASRSLIPCDPGHRFHAIPVSFRLV